MNVKTLKLLLNLNEREKLHQGILTELAEFGKIGNVIYKKYQTSEGIIPFVFIGKDFELNEVKHIKIFIGAQHNEYNGLFGIIKFLKRIKNGKVDIDNILIDKQILIFAPLMNPYGFLNPRKDNKSGYYLKNGTNLNRFWRRTFAPEYTKLKDDSIESPIPEQCKILKDLLKDYWEDKKTNIYLLDFHETSLLTRFPIELSKELSIYYKFDHWLKEYIILNIMKLYGIKYYRKPLFYKRNPNFDHSHINLSIKQVDIVFEKLLDYIAKNQGKLAFYFCHSNVSAEYCKRLAEDVYNNLKEKNILWDTFSPAYSHFFHDHGCFVKMSDATARKNVYTMELESQKQFFNIFNEIEKSKTDPNYFEKKLKFVNYSLELVIESITQMIKLF